MTADQLLVLINSCCLPKLSRNFGESESHPEFAVRDRNLVLKFDSILKNLRTLSSKDYSLHKFDIISSLLILYIELKSESFGNPDTFKAYSDNLNLLLQCEYNITLDTILTVDKDAQGILDITLDRIHARLTVQDLNKNPSIILVYCKVISNIKNSKISLVPQKLLSTSLILIEDSLIENKIKGLQCCYDVLQCLSPTDLEGGNYYEVLNQTLLKRIYEKDAILTQELLKCLAELTNKLSMEIKVKNGSDIYCLLLEQLLVESNLNRKAILFEYTTKFIDVIKSNCIRKKKIFFKIIYDNLDISCNKCVGDILLNPILVCFETWLRQGWCTWSFLADRKILTALIKVLVVYCKLDQASVIRNMIIAIIDLCNLKERKIIMKNFDTVHNNFNSKPILTHLTIMQNEIR